MYAARARMCFALSRQDLDYVVVRLRPWLCGLGWPPCPHCPHSATASARHVLVTVATHRQLGGRPCEGPVDAAVRAFLDFRASLVASRCKPRFKRGICPLSYSPRQRVTEVVFDLGFPTKILYAFLMSLALPQPAVRATRCPFAMIRGCAALGAVP